MSTFLRTLRARYDHGHEIGQHHHGWGQIVFASCGAIHVSAAGQTWLIPSARAVWLPPNTTHRLRMRGPTSLRTLYVPPAHCKELPATPLGLAVSPLLRELILELARIGHIDGADPFHAALGTVLLASLARAKRLPLALTLPADRRALRAAETILANPTQTGALADLAARCGSSLRTLQRRFLDETGLPLSEWRQTARLMAGAAALLDGKSVTDAALDAGYGSLSAFIHAFGAKFGQSPSDFKAASFVNNDAKSLLF
jgi:AraC-like DNA-binding protein